MRGRGVLMASVAEVLKGAENRGIHFSVFGDRLLVNFPDGQETETAKAWVQEHKAEIIAHG